MDALPDFGPSQPAWLTNLPKLGPVAPAAPPSTGFLPAMGAALTSGTLGIGSDLARTVQGIGALTGLPRLQAFGAAGARGWDQRAQATGAPDLEAQGMFESPTSFAYHVAKAIPSTAAMIGGAALAPETTLGRLAGAGVAAFPSMFGSNIQNEEQSGPLTQGGAARAAGLAVPESAAMGLMPSSLKKFAESGLTGDTVKRMFTAGGAAAAQQAGAQAGITATTDAVYNPEMPADERARRIVSAALSGGAMGLVFGGAFGAIRRATPHLDVNAPTQALDDATRMLEGPEAPKQLTYQPSTGFPGEPTNRPINVNSAGEASTNPAEVVPNPAIRAGGPKIAALPPPEKVVPIPEIAGPLEQAPSNQVKALHDALTGQDKMDAGQVGQLAAVREELIKRTMPGLKPGEGNLFTPAEVTARQPQVDAIKAGLDLPEAAQKTPFFKNLNAASEPELINAIDAELKTHDRVSKADATADNPARKATPVPDWLQKIAEDNGLMDGKKPSSPAQKLEDLNLDREQTQKVLDAATPIGGSQLRDANRRMADINADISKFEALHQVHQEAAVQLADAKVLKAPNGGPAATTPPPPPLPEKPTGKELLDYPMIRTPLANLKIDATTRVPDAAGVSASDRSTVFVDSRIPQFAKIMNVTMDMHQAVARHEIAEAHGALDLNEPYEKSHLGMGNPAEEQYVKDIAVENGKNPKAFYRYYQNWWKKQIDVASKDDGKPVSPDLAIYPYKGDRHGMQQVEGESAQVQKPGATPVGAGEPSGVGGGVGPGDAARAAAGARPDVTVTPEAAKANGNEQAGAGGTRTAAQVGLKPNLKMAPEWANAAAAQDHGEVVFAHPDGDHAVTRSFDAWGDPQYQMITRTGAIPEARKIGELKAAIMQDKVQDKFEAQKRPDGPWTGKTDSVVGTKSIDPSDVGLVAGWLRQVGMGATKVALVHPQDARGDVATQEGLNGPYQSARFAGSVGNAGEFTGQGVMDSFGPKRNEFYISTDPNLPQAAKVDTLGHEVGHVIERTEFRNAPAATQKAVVDAHAQYLSKTQGVPLQDVIKMTRLRSQTDDVSNLTSDQQATFRSYVTSFTEWFADNVSRELTSAQEPTSVIGKFFYGVAQKMRQLMQTISGNQFLPDAAVAKFMSDLRANATPEMWSNDLSRGRMGDKVPVGEPTQFKLAPRKQDEDMVASVNQVRGIWDRVTNTAANLGVQFQRATMAVKDYASLAKIAPEHMKGPITSVHNVHQETAATTDAKNLVNSKGMQPYWGLDEAKQKQVDAALLSHQNPWELDGRKPWAYYKDLHDAPNSAELKVAHTKLVNEVNSLRTGGLLPAFNSILRMHQITGLQGNVAAAQVFIDRTAKTDSPLMGADYVPSDFRFTNPRASGLDPLMHDDPEKAFAYYKAENAAIMKALDDRINAVKGAAAAFTGKEKTQAADSVASEKALLRSMQDRTGQVEKGIYSPIGHGKGNYFAAGKITLGADQKMDPKAATAVQDALDKNGFSGIRLLFDSDSNTIMARVADAGQRDRLSTIFKGLESQGHMIGGESKTGNVDNVDTIGRLGPKQFQSMVEAVKDMVGRMGVAPDEAEAIQGRLISNWLDTQSDRSILPNQSKRAYISGADIKMGKVAGEVAMNSARASSITSLSGAKADAMTNMRAADIAAKATDSGITPQQAEWGHNTAQEIIRREKEAQWEMPADILDKITAINHTIQIGFSPAYTILPVSQIVTLLHPELSKKFGYMKSGATIAGETSMAFKVLGAVLRSPDRFNVTFREEALRKAGIPEWYIDKTMRLANAGNLNSFTMYMTGLNEESNKLHTALHAANAMGTYAEMVPRLVAAFSAARLYEGAKPGFVKGPRGEPLERDDYVNSVVNDSQFNWAAGETPRAFSNKGTLGRVSKLSFAFMNYRERMLAKIYTETHDLMSGALGGPSVSPQVRKEAGTFLAAHLAAATVLAGTLGLPGAAFMAGLYNKSAAAWTGRDDINIEGSYRHWLTSVFGHDMEEVISHGAPRAAGVDMSKLGDANLLPGTGIMVDQRKLEDAEKDWLKSMAGAPTNEIVNMALGGRDIMNGDWLLGATRMLPEGFKGLAEAAYMDKHGYVDKYGTQYPMQPGARDILAAAIGLDPANLASQQEQRRIEQSENAMREYRAQNIERHLVLGINQGRDISPWINAAAEFTRQHPGEGGPLEGMGRSIQSHLMQGAQARMLGVPLGVKPLDLGLIRTTQF